MKAMTWPPSARVLRPRAKQKSDSFWPIFFAILQRQEGLPTLVGPPQGGSRDLSPHKLPRCVITGGELRDDQADNGLDRIARRQCDDGLDPLGHQLLVDLQKAEQKIALRGVVAVDRRHGHVRVRSDILELGVVEADLGEQLGSSEQDLLAPLLLLAVS